MKIVRDDGYGLTLIGIVIVVGLLWGAMMAAYGLSFLALYGHWPR